MNDYWNFFQEKKQQIPTINQLFKWEYRFSITHNDFSYFHALRMIIIQLFSEK